jgi:hypothetical protein
MLNRSGPNCTAILPTNPATPTTSSICDTPTCLRAVTLKSPCRDSDRSGRFWQQRKYQADFQTLLDVWQQIQSWTSRRLAKIRWLVCASVMIRTGSWQSWYQRLIFCVGFYVLDFILLSVQSEKNIDFVFGGYLIARPRFFFLYYFKLYSL